MKSILIASMLLIATSISSGSEQTHKIFREDAYMPCSVIIDNIKALQAYKKQQEAPNHEELEWWTLFLVAGVIAFGDLREDPKEINIDDAVTELQERLKTCEPY